MPPLIHKAKVVKVPKSPQHKAVEKFIGKQTWYRCSRCKAQHGYMPQRCQKCKALGKFVVEIPADECSACQGTGKNSKGGLCFPCGATGKLQKKWRSVKCVE